MAALNKIKVGQTLFSVTREQAGNTTMRRTAVRPINVREIDLDKRKVFASWNYNPPQWFFERSWRRWKVNKPKSEGRL